jgi:hypothetical protein
MLFRCGVEAKAHNNVTGLKKITHFSRVNSLYFILWQREGYALDVEEINLSEVATREFLLDYMLRLCGKKLVLLYCEDKGRVGLQKDGNGRKEYRGPAVAASLSHALGRGSVERIQFCNMNFPYPLQTIPINAIALSDRYVAMRFPIQCANQKRNGAGGIVVVKALCYRPEGRGFNT